MGVNTRSIVGRINYYINVLYLLYVLIDIISVSFWPIPIVLMFTTKIVDIVLFSF